MINCLAAGPLHLLFQKNGKIRAISEGGNDGYSTITGKAGEHTGPAAAVGEIAA
jgi:hypothetical protein